MPVERVEAHDPALRPQARDPHHEHVVARVRVRFGDPDRGQFDGDQEHGQVRRVVAPEHLGLVPAPVPAHPRVGPGPEHVGCGEHRRAPALGPDDGSAPGPVPTAHTHHRVPHLAQIAQRAFALARARPAPPVGRALITAARPGPTRSGYAPAPGLRGLFLGHRRGCRDRLHLRLAGQGQRDAHLTLAVEIGVAGEQRAGDGNEHRDCRGA